MYGHILWEYKQGHYLLSYIIIYTYLLLPPANFIYSVYSITLLVPNTATGATSTQLCVYIYICDV